MKSGDDEQPLGIFFQEVHTQDGRLMVVAKLVPLIYTTKGFHYDFQRARPSWFTAEELREFLDAVNTVGAEP